MVKYETEVWATRWICWSATLASTSTIVGLVPIALSESCDDHQSTPLTSAVPFLGLLTLLPIVSCLISECTHSNRMILTNLLQFYYTRSQASYISPWPNQTRRTNLALSSSLSILVSLIVSQAESSLLLSKEPIHSTRSLPLCQVLRRYHSSPRLDFDTILATGENASQGSGDQCKCHRRVRWDSPGYLGGICCVSHIQIFS